MGVPRKVCSLREMGSFFFFRCKRTIVRGKVQAYTVGQDGDVIGQVSGADELVDTLPSPTMLLDREW